jgi:hypothetical protein
VPNVTDANPACRRGSSNREALNLLTIWTSTQEEAAVTSANHDA